MLYHISKQIIIYAVSLLLLFIVIHKLVAPAQRMLADKTHLRVVYKSYYKKSDSPSKFTLKQYGLKSNSDNMTVKRDLVVNGIVTQSICMIRNNLYKGKGELFLTKEGFIVWVSNGSNIGLEFDSLYDSFILYWKS